MPLCKNCNSHFPSFKVINGKRRNLQRRKFCLVCSPFGSHNTRPIISESNEIPRCYKCGIEGREHFYKRANREGKFYSYCKKCYNQQSLDRQNKNKLFNTYSA